MPVTVNERTKQTVLKQPSIILHQNPYHEEKDEFCLEVYVSGLGM